MDEMTRTQFDDFEIEDFCLNADELCCEADGETKDTGQHGRRGNDDGGCRPAIRPGMCSVYRRAYDSEEGGATVTNTDSADVTSTGGPRADEDLPLSVRRCQRGSC